MNADRERRIADAMDIAHDAMAVLNAAPLDLTPSQRRALSDLYESTAILIAAVRDGDV